MKYLRQWRAKAGFLLASVLFAGFVATPNVLAAASWQNVGSAGFSAGSVSYTSLAFNGSTPYVAYEDSTDSNKATVMKFDGSNWVTVGTDGFSAGTAYYTSLAFDGGTPYLAYGDGGNGIKTTVMKFDGSNWVTVGSAGFARDVYYSFSLVFDGGPP